MENQDVESRYRNNYGLNREFVVANLVQNVFFQDISAFLLEMFSKEDKRKR